MRSSVDVERVFEMREQHGWGAPRIAAATCVSATQVGRWLRNGRDRVLGSPLRLAAARLLPDSLDGPAYAYLLGQYLGDGTIVRVRRSERLEISTTADYPGIRAEAHAAILAVMGRPAHERIGKGVVVVASYGVLWPTLFPQHGPGKKHLRRIKLADWQAEIALDRHPDQLLRGLVHSDGCRVINRVVSRGTRFEYPPLQLFERVR